MTKVELVDKILALDSGYQGFDERVTIKKQIAALPDGDLKYIEQGTGFAEQSDPLVTTAALKALADSHTRLLAAAKAVDYDMQGVDTAMDTRVEFARAIEEAEAL